MHDMTILRIMNPQCEMKTTMDDRIGESDADSFHSAISTVTERNSRHRQVTSDDNPTTTKMIIKHNNAPSRPRSRRTCSLQSTSTQNQHPKPRSKPSRHESISIPHRRSSLPRQKHRARKDSTTLHLQNRHIFTSLDGMLAMNAEITPLPSVSNSRTTTRHTSLSPDVTHDPDYTKRGCGRLDARLATAAESEALESKYPYSYGYPYALSANSIENSPTLPSGFNPQVSEHSSLLSRSTIMSATKAQQRPQLSTVVSWTSNTTRRTEYEKIDRAHTGVRGLVRRVWPQCMRKKDARRGFYKGDCDGDSVRRFRMDVSDEESDAEDEAINDEFDEKYDLNSEHACTTRDKDTNEKTEKEKKPPAKKPWWSCFEP